MPLFSRTDKPSACSSCKSSCVEKKEADDALSQSYADTIKKVLGKSVNASATEKSSNEGQAYMYSADASKCKTMAYRLENEGVLNRFNRYRQALPYARAAEDLNGLGDEPDSEKKQIERLKKCLTKLPDTGRELSLALNLPEGTIKDEDLRNDTTGFRAAVYRSETNGQLILVARDTQPQSLVDWKTNTDNGLGRDTAQYESMREITSILSKKGVSFDISGYSKGGGLAQEGGLVSTDSKVMVFNSAGLHNASLSRTGQSSFDDLASRTQSFNAKGDFLTFMNNTEDPKQQIANARFLRNELAGDGFMVKPLKIKYRNPEMKKAKEEAWVKAYQETFINANYCYYGEFYPQLYYKNPDPSFSDAKRKYIGGLDQMIADAEKKQKKREAFRLFPPVRSYQVETVPNSIPWYNWENKVENDNPNLAKLIQHLISNVTSGLDKTIDEDKKAMKKFVKECG